MIFNKSADYYDIVYGGKDYKKEVDFVEKAIKKFSPIKVKTILSLGCGTANHDIIMAKHGYSILGLDASKQMIEIAKKKAQDSGVTMDLKVADITKFKTQKKFDFVMAMFNILGYMKDNKDMESVLKNSAASLKKNGILVFDCWYGPAVLKDRPQDRLRKFEGNGREIIRKTTQRFDIEKGTIDITFHFTENGKLIAKENHIMRFWFLNELKYFLEKSGFELVTTCNFLDFKSKISENVWNIFVVAKKK